MRRRILRPEEKELWKTVTQTANPLHPDRQEPPIIGSVPDSAPIIVTDVSPKQPKIPNFRLGERSGVTQRPITAAAFDPLIQAPLRMDAKTHGKMSRGKLSPDATLDLHGMTLAEAHPELLHFVLSSYSAGLRLLLVITGKGKQKSESGPTQRAGVLRHQTPSWLRLPPLGAVVLQVTQAHLRHGGAGAFYVYLKRR
jgi:DNA-nicking Smr family endonuclease